MVKDPTIQNNAINHARSDMSSIPTASHDVPASAEPAKAKIGAEHAKGMLKLGAHELTQALAAFPDSNVRPMEEPGVLGNETMPHITDAREHSAGGDYHHGLDEASHDAQFRQKSKDRGIGR